MKDFVSEYWVRVVALVAALGVLWAVFGPASVPFTSLIWVVAALSAGAVVAGLFRSRRPMSQIIDDVEAERNPVAGTPVRVAMPAQRRLDRRGEGTL